MEPILKIKNLNISFERKDGIVHAVTNANLDVKKGKIFGLIGETGCGKSVLAHSIIRLLPQNVTTKGEIIYKGQDITFVPIEYVRKLRGREIGLIAQNPAEALNPLFKNGNQVMAPMKLHRKLSYKKSWEKAVQLLTSLGIRKPNDRMKEYPHHLSGGMKQRVLTALGIAADPELLIADEPTKGLDSVIKKQVVEVLQWLVAEKGTTILLITHDIHVAYQVCDDLAVMYAGEIVEQGPTEKLFHNPIHPYLKGLIGAMPSRGLIPIPGSSPSLLDLPEGCRFYERCSYADKRCHVTPPYQEIQGRKVRCWVVD